LETKPKKPRQVFLTGDEARKVWEAAGRIAPPYGPAIRLLLATAVRLREATGARWSEFNADRSEWTISGDRMKVGEPHVVWLPPPVREMLAGLPRFAGSDLVFTNGKQEIAGFTALKRKLDKALEGAGVKEFTFHDFRRSVTTWLVRAKVADSIVADRLLAHTKLAGVSAVASTYNIYDFEAERRVALERWVDFLIGGEAETSVSAPLMLPAPSSTSATLAEVVDEEETPQTGPTVFFPVPVPDWTRTQEVQEEAIRLVLRITNRRGVIRVAQEILKRQRKRFAPVFLKTLGPSSDPNEKALELLAHMAASAYLDRITVFKRDEVEALRAEWAEQAQRWRDNATRLRLEAKQARAIGQGEFAAELDAKILKAETIAGGWEEALRTQMAPDDVCATAHSKGGPEFPEARAHGVYHVLHLLTKQIFAAPAPGIAAAYATAATGIEASRWWGRPAVRDGKAGSPERAAH
jgi:Phage integrase family